MSAAEVMDSASVVAVPPSDEMTLDAATLPPLPPLSGAYGLHASRDCALNIVGQHTLIPDLGVAFIFAKAAIASSRRSFEPS